MRIMRERTARLRPAALGIAAARDRDAGGPVLAQETTGNVAGFVTSDKDGTALPGVTVIAHQRRKAASSASQVTDTEGSYRFNLLPVGRYTLTASLEGYQTLKQDHVNVTLGRTTQVAFSLPDGQRRGSHHRHFRGSADRRLDGRHRASTCRWTSWPTASRSPTTSRRSRCSRPAPRPATRRSTPLCGAYTPGQRLTSIGGGSVAENNYIINGLNVSNFRNGVGGSNVPFEFVKEVQVKSGGYEAEFGRSTGGVLNMISRSGSNAFHGGVQRVLQPRVAPGAVARLLRRPQLARGARRPRGQRLARRADLEGPRLLLRLLPVQRRRFTRVDIGRETLRNYDDPYYGGKLDINLTQNHRLEGTYFTDEVEVDSDAFDHDEDTRQRGTCSARAPTTPAVRTSSAATPASSAATSCLSGQYGENDFNRTILSSGDAFSAVVDSRDRRPDLHRQLRQPPVQPRRSTTARRPAPTSTASSATTRPASASTTSSTPRSDTDLVLRRRLLPLLPQRRPLPAGARLDRARPLSHLPGRRHVRDRVQRDLRPGLVGDHSALDGQLRPALGAVRQQERPRRELHQGRRPVRAARRRGVGHQR